ncbi:MAG TPA: hypothetical protein VH601_08165 [Bryobacteraceae bacterium]|jgi:hypothetical protein
MSENPDAVTPEDDSDWPRNYFNYFTEIEEHFQRARGTGLFLLSPLDWALIETWKNAGVPLAAVLKGIDEAFKKWRSRKVRRRLINSLAYCTQAVLEAAQRLPGEGSAPVMTEAPFAADELRNHLGKAAEALRERSGRPFEEVASALETLSADIENQMHDLEGLERRLTAMEDKMVAAVRSVQREEDLLLMREKLDRDLKPYRSKMTADQLALLEHRYLDTALLERARLPRISLFYLH